MIIENDNGKCLKIFIDLNDISTKKFNLQDIFKEMFCNAVKLYNQIT